MDECPVGGGDRRSFEKDGYFGGSETIRVGIKRLPVDQADAAAAQKKLRLDVVAEQARYIEAISQWNEDDQVELFCLLLSHMSQTQRSRINSRIRLLASHQRGSLLFRSSA
ncbi:hypothetical protein ECG_04887 [Echinococcus granulosus]|uniref:Expressed conserved protein n=1 Tax=Echinococcus granulosus TaxID=6210 RepID=A0A068W9U8_ECHGR|nr:hypothetical protein ECG_04887 [Echinococcus granulosus]CDS16779.1 expressed conserved protein [Echinococcus granulosus]